MSSLDLYAPLRIDIDSQHGQKISADDVQRAFLQLISEQCSKNVCITEAIQSFRILSSPDLKRTYDLYGYDGLCARMGNSLSQIQQLASATNLQNDLQFDLPVTLEELHRGVNKTLRYHRTVVCPSCAGTGSADLNLVRVCPECNAESVVAEYSQHAENQVTERYSLCRLCCGAGTIHDKTNNAMGTDKKTEPHGDLKNSTARFDCEQCRGLGILQQVKALSIRSEPGARDNDIVVYNEDANAQPGMRTGNVHVTFRVVAHDVFQLRGNELFLRHTLTLVEALYGFELHVKDLDDVLLTVTSETNRVYRPGDVLTVANRGMASRHKPRGDLFVELDVAFPLHMPLIPPEHVPILS